MKDPIAFSTDNPVFSPQLVHSLLDMIAKDDNSEIKHASRDLIIDQATGPIGQPLREYFQSCGCSRMRSNELTLFYFCFVFSCRAVPDIILKHAFRPDTGKTATLTEVCARVFKLSGDDHAGMHAFMSRMFSNVDNAMIMHHTLTLIDPSPALRKCVAELMDLPYYKNDIFGIMLAAIAHTRKYPEETEEDKLSTIFQLGVEHGMTIMLHDMLSGILNITQGAISTEGDLTTGLTWEHKMATAGIEPRSVDDDVLEELLKQLEADKGFAVDDDDDDADTATQN